MQGFLVRWLVSALALYLTSLIVRGIAVDGVPSLLVAALMIGILNAFVRPLVLLLTLPLTILQFQALFGLSSTDRRACCIASSNACL